MYYDVTRRGAFVGAVAVSFGIRCAYFDRSTLTFVFHLRSNEYLTFFVTQLQFIGQKLNI